MIPFTLPYPPGVRPPATQNREEWLTRVAVYLRPWFKKRGFPIPQNIKLSVGSMTKVRSKLGVCWNAYDRDNNRHIVISPFIDDAVEVGDTLCHELVHALLPPEIGHKKPFNDACEALGLTKGKGTTRSAGPELREHLEWIVSERVGPYPHSALSPIKMDRDRKPRKVIRNFEGDTNPKPGKLVRLKLFCPGCKSIIRVAQRTLKRQPFLTEVVCSNEACTDFGELFDIQSDVIGSKRS